jgi:four helix bundle protein
MITSYKDLEVWKRGIDLSVQIYKLTSGFPSHEAFTLTAQIRRAVTSIPANIAEGFGRESTRSYVSFLRISIGSLFELESHMILAGELNYLDTRNLSETIVKIEILGKMLNTQIRKLNQHIS